MTRISASCSKASRIAGTACHMSSEMAFRRPGLLNTIQPIAPSFSAIMRSLGEIIASSSSYDALGAKAGDGVAIVAELAQHRVGVRAALGRCRHELRGRAAQRHGLSHQLRAAERRMLDRLRDSEMLDLGVGEDFIHAIDRSARHPGAVEDL